MGIPKFYRWLSERYPLINQKIDGPVCPEFDALYLDMNAIFHRCSHGSEVNKYTITKQQMFTDIFKYISYLVELVKPKHLLYLAVDGVAPRAKQNQQRQRRFVGAQEQKSVLESDIDNGREYKYKFDSNTITPGTRWMEELSRQLELYIRKQMSENYLWRHLNVIYSDHLVPGEGEHKIMQHIRHSKMQINYNPNTRHCIYGLDADLIILSLVSHELHFALLREEIIFALHEQESINKRTRRRLTKKDEFQLLHITVLRNYLFIEFSSISSLLSFKFDFERIIDDFVFVSMFVGNDFIPHLPTVNIGTGGLEQLFQIYKQVLPSLDGYIIEQGKINLNRFKKLCQRLAENEIESFVSQFQFLKQYHEKAARRKYSYFPMTQIEKTTNFRQLTVDELEQEIISLRDSTNEKTIEQFRNKYYRSRWRHNEEINLTKEERKKICLDYIRALQWVMNYYYQGCCSWSYYYPHHYAPLVSDMCFIDEINDNEYIQLFELSQPYKPFEQLLAVLPKPSNNVLPKCYRKLMEDKDSIISKYYPEHFKVDMNLSVSPWEGIALLPFINEKELKQAIKTLHEQYDNDNNDNDSSLLTEEEKYINSHKEAIMFKYDYQKSLKKNRIKGPIGFGPIADDVVCFKYKLPTLDHCDNKFSPTICNGAKNIIQGSPHLAAIPFLTQIKKVPVKTFGMSSKYQTLVLQVIDADNPNNQNNDNSTNMSDNRSVMSHGSNTTHGHGGRGGVGHNNNQNNSQIQQQYENLALTYLKKFLSHPLYVGWPYFREAQIAEINTINFTHSIVHLLDNKTHTMTNQLTQQQRTKFKKMCHSVSQKYLTIFGVDIGDIHILIKCRLLWGMVKDGDNIIKKWHEREEIFPIQICICGTSKSHHDNIGSVSKMGSVVSSSTNLSSSNPSGDGEDEKSTILDNSSTVTAGTIDIYNNQSKTLIIDDRYISRPLKVRDTIDVGQPVMYIGPQKKYYGLYGRITSKPQNGYVDIRVLSRFQPTDFPHRVLAAYTKMKYYTLEEASHMLMLDYKVLSRICAQVIVVNKPQDFDIGLNLKLYKKRLLIPGYCLVQFFKKKQSPRKGRDNGRGRKGKNNGSKEKLLVKISEKGVDLIKRYKEKFPEVFSVLRCKHYSKQFYPDEFCLDTMKRLLPGEAGKGGKGKGKGKGNRNRAPKKQQQQQHTIVVEEEEVVDFGAPVRDKPSQEVVQTPTVESLGVEEVEEEEVVMDFGGADDTKNEQVQEEEEEVDMSGDINVEELSAEDYKMLMRTKKCAEGKNFLMKINDWLKEQEVTKLPLIDFNAKFFPADIMKQMEAEADKYYTTQIRSTPKAYHLKRVPVGQVYLANPEIPWSPTGKQTFHLANRISVLRSDEGIPFGTQGTVVGIHDKFLEIITDCNVMKGNTLHNRVSDHRGVILPYTSVINLTPGLKPPNYDMEQQINNHHDMSHKRMMHSINDNQGRGGRNQHHQQHGGHHNQRGGNQHHGNNQYGGNMGGPQHGGNQHGGNQHQHGGRGKNRNKRNNNRNNRNNNNQYGGRNNQNNMGGNNNNNVMPLTNQNLMNLNMMNANNNSANNSNDVQTPLSSVPSIPNQGQFGGMNPMNLGMNNFNNMISPPIGQQNLNRNQFNFNNRGGNNPLNSQSNNSQSSMPNMMNNMGGMGNMPNMPGMGMNLPNMPNLPNMNLPNMNMPFNPMNMNNNQNNQNDNNQNNNNNNNRGGRNNNNQNNNNRGGRNNNNRNNNRNRGNNSNNNQNQNNNNNQGGFGGNNNNNNPNLNMNPNNLNFANLNMNPSNLASMNQMGMNNMNNMQNNLQNMQRQMQLLQQQQNQMNMNNMGGNNMNMGMGGNNNMNMGGNNMGMGSMPNNGPMGSIPNMPNMPGMGNMQNMNQFGGLNNFGNPNSSIPNMFSPQYRQNYNNQQQNNNNNNNFGNNQRRGY